MTEISETQVRAKGFFCLLFFCKRKVREGGIAAALSGLHGGVELIGDGTLEEGGGVTVEGFQAAGGHTGIDLSAHKEVHIQDKFDFRILGGVGTVFLDHSGAGVDLGTAGSVPSQFHVHGALLGSPFFYAPFGVRAHYG